MRTLLRYFNAIQKLSEEDRSYIAGLIKTVELRPGESWIAYSSGLGVACVEKGLVKRIERKGKRIEHFFKGGEGFTLMQPRLRWLYIAIEPTTICYVAHEDMEDICNRHLRYNALPNAFMGKEWTHRDNRRQIEEPSDPLTRYQLFALIYPMYLRRLPLKELGLYLEMSPKMVEALREKRSLKHM